MLRLAAVKLWFLSIRWRRGRIVLRNLVPNGLNQLKLVFHAELARFIKKICIHGEV